MQVISRKRLEGSVDAAWRALEALSDAWRFASRKKASWKNLADVRRTFLPKRAMRLASGTGLQHQGETSTGWITEISTISFGGIYDSVAFQWLTPGMTGEVGRNECDGSPI